MSDCRFFQTADTALTVSKSSAFTCVGTFALTPTFDLLVWHVWRDRLAVPEQFGALMQLRDGAGVFDRVSRAWVTDGKAQPWPLRLLFQAVESQASGVGLIQQGASEGRPFKVLKADKDKVQRCGPVAGLYEAGKVWHRGGVPWLARFEDELLVFPSGTFKDQCDVLGYAGILATEDRFLRSFQGSELLCWPPVPEKPATPQGDKPVETVQNAMDSVLERMLAEEEADQGRLPPLLRD